MKKLLALLLALCMVLSLAACGKKPADTDGTGASQDAGNNEDTEWTYIHVENTGNFQKDELVTGTGMNAVDTEILNNDDLINPEKFSGKKLQINGVGYRCEKKGNEVFLKIGFSHEVSVKENADIQLEVPDANTIIVKGIDKQKVGQFAAEVRGKRPPEPYKGKGIKYTNEVIRRKVGKTGGKK